MFKVFIDGREGTTGLRIIDRLSGRKDIELMLIPEELRKDPDERKKYLNACDVAFLCLPDAAAIEAVSMIENENVRVIDTSTAHRTNPDWVYGFPELYDSLAKALPTAKRVAVPGCHASGFNALIAPLTEAGVLSHDALVTCFSLTGYSGGGKKMIAEYEGEDKGDELFSARIYALSQSHKHLPEMAAISKLQNKPVFSPIVDDYYSGMLVTVPFFKSQVNGGIEAVKQAYINKYSGKQFIDISDINGEKAAMLGSNNLSGKDKMQIFVTGNEERFTVSARFDNLGKGASGAAVQCMNIMLGFDEAEGLDL
ncbi:MAG: N-acetyl-gamma-glutamyl-phosphate reductase [Clostridia bacterium]|nr:N-acetyl-gamma-glutamyl-phosphate reductase [Clostridia bacterium]